MDCDVCQKGESLSRDASREVNCQTLFQMCLGQIFPWILYGTTCEVQGYDAILVVCDRFTKQVHIIPTTKETNSLGLAHLYQDHVWKYIGLPNMVISDHGLQFVSGFMKELNKILGSTQNYLLPITRRQMDKQRG